MPDPDPVATELVQSHVFGLKQDVANHIHCIEDNIVAYPAGRSIVIYNLATKKQQFILDEAKDEKDKKPKTITALAMSPNRRFLAAAYRTSEKAMIRVFDVRTLRLRKEFSSSTQASPVFCSLCFSPEGRYLLSMSTAPDYMLSNWEWEKGTLLHYESVMVKASAPYYQCSFCPFDATLVAVTGYKTLRLYKVSPKEKQMQHVETKAKIGSNNLCHEWLSSSHLLVGTETGKLLLFENGALRKQMLDSADGKAITFIKLYNVDKSFVFGTGAGSLGVMQRQRRDEDLAEDFKKTKEFVVQQKPAAVRCLALSPAGDNVFITMENSQMFVLSSFSLDVRNPREMKFAPLGELGHDGRINDMDVCVRKPVVVTCGADKSIRIWDFAARTCENIKYFNEEPLSISVHPSGFHIVVGFVDKLRFMNVLMDDIRTVKEFPLRNVQEVRFSRGGQFFAAAKNNVISVFDTYTCKQRDDLTIRHHGGRVTSLYWSGGDEAIASCGHDGAAYLSTVAEDGQPRLNELQQKSTNFSSVLASHDEKLYIAGDGDKVLEVTDGRVSAEVPCATDATHICIGHRPQRLFFAGTATGDVVSYKFPFAGVYSQGYRCHAGAVTKVCIASDDGAIVSAAADGTLAIWRVADSPFRSSADQKVADTLWSEEVMVSKADLEDKHAAVQALRQKVKVLLLRNESELQQHGRRYEEDVQDSTQKCQLQLEEQGARFKSLAEEMADMKADYEEKERKFKKRSQQELEKLDATHQNTLLGQIKQYQQVEREYKEAQDSFDANLKALQDRHAALLMRMEGEQQDRVSQAEVACRKAKIAKMHVMRQFEETKRQLEIDSDLEIEKLKRKYEAKLDLERDMTLRLNGENGIMKKRFAALNKDIHDQAEELREVEETTANLDARIVGLRREIEMLKKQISKMDKTISERETQIYDLKRENQDLEKHKFVLDYKIKNQRRQIEPRENEIASMKKRVLALDGVLEDLHRNNGRLKENKARLEKLLTEVQEKERLSRQRLGKRSDYINTLIKAIQNAVELVQKPDKLREAANAMAERFAKVVKPAPGAQEGIEDEYEFQTRNLKAQARTLKRKLQVESTARRKDIEQIMRQNMTLLAEIQEKRESLARLQTTLVGGETSSSKSKTKSKGYSRGEARKIISLQRRQIENLRQEVDLVSTRLGLKSSARPVSRERAAYA